MVKNNQDLIAQQIELEKEITLKTQENYRRLFNEAKENDNLSCTQSVQRLLNKALVPYVQSINDYKQRYMKGKTVSAAAAKALVQLLNSLSVEQIAYISMKIILNSLYKEINRQKIAEKIIEALENEVKLKLFKKINSDYYDAVMEELKKRNARIDWKCKALSISYNKKFEADYKGIDGRTVYKLGFILLELFRQSTELIEFNKIYEKGKIKIFVVARAETLEWIEKTNNFLEVLHPFFLPMVCEPREWTGVYSGGYISPYLVRNKFVKNPDKEYLKLLDKIQMPEVYQAVNTIQSTPWQINYKVLNTVVILWEKGISIGGLPDRENIEPPPFPFPNLTKENRTEEQKNIIRKWKNEAVAAYKQNIQSRSIRLLTAQILQLAQRFSNYKNIWFPYQLDFRGRIYPIPALLQPQGNDLAKGLLMFGKGAKLNNQDAVNWLMIHGANTFGEDKISYEDRIKWIKEHESEILSYAENPCENQGWAKADKPFQFLAFCFEYLNYKQNGYDAVTYLPVYVDGTCNGLQHYSALLKDETAGKAVNLINAEKPSDIYEKVAEKLNERLINKIANYNTNGDNPEYNNHTGDRLLASRWLELGINRKLTKRPVMVLPYGGTKLSCRAYIEEYLTDNYSLGFLYEHFGYIGKDPHTTIFKASRWLANVLWASIEETLKSAIVGMEYIRHKLKGHKDTAIEWVTPCGLLVHQAYKNTTFSKIKTELYGSVYKLNVLLPSKDEKLSPQKQTNGICPNFIHSIDAACLMKFLNKAKEQGIESFGAVHDSYGTLACHTSLTQKLLREAFVEIYDTPEGEKDILEMFIEDITGEEVKDLPQKGNLDIKEVLKSDYFFN